MAGGSSPGADWSIWNGEDSDLQSSASPFQGRTKVSHLFFRTFYSLLAMGRRISPFRQQGHSLVELLLVLAILGICFAAGTTSLARGLRTVESRGAAEAWQAAATWAQTTAVWHAEPTEVRFGSGHLSVAADSASNSGDLGASAPDVPVGANVVRWQQGEGVVVRFLSASAHPDSAGSLYFRSLDGEYRVTVRLESGLTVRTRVGGQP
jgi:prepilin-type N-terminal cleavage/methylation domain-containing protein